METINASELKAKLLAVLDQVKDSGEALLILKRGRPVARLVPPTPEHDQYPQEALRGTVRTTGDIIGPAVPEDHWEALS